MMSFYRIFLVGSLLLQFSCEREHIDSQLSIIGGEEGELVPNLIKFVNPRTGLISCGSGLVVNTHVVITANHCAELGLDTLGLNGHVPVSSFNVSSLEPEQQDLYKQKNRNAVNEAVEKSMDLLVLVYPPKINLIKELKITRIVNISPYAPGVTSDDLGSTGAHPMALIGFGLKSFANYYEKKKLDPLEKEKFFTKGFGINTMKYINFGIMGFVSSNKGDDPLKAGISHGDSGGVVVDSTYHITGIISFYRTPLGYKNTQDDELLIDGTEPTVEYDSQAIDLTSARAKLIFRRAILCQTNKGEICASWFPESGVESPYKIGANMIAYTALENPTKESLRDALRNLAKNNSGPFATGPLSIARVIPGTPADRAGLRTGMKAFLSTEGISTWTDSIFLLVDIAGRTNSTVNFQIADSSNQFSRSSPIIAVKPEKLDEQGMNYRDERSMQFGSLDARPDQFRAYTKFIETYGVDYYYQVVPRWVGGTSYRALLVTRVEPKSLAEAGGLQVNDFILEVNHRLIRHQSDMFRAYEQSRVPSPSVDTNGREIRIARFVVSRKVNDINQTKILEFPVQLLQKEK